MQGKVVRDGVVWWSIDHASYAGTARGARVSHGIVAVVPDLFVLHRGIAQMVEIKTQTGELTAKARNLTEPVVLTGGSANEAAKRWHLPHGV